MYLTAMVSIHEKFKILIKELDLTIPQFAKELGYERADNFYSITSGRSKPGWDIIEAIARTFPQVNLDWLLRDNNNVFKTLEKNPATGKDFNFELQEKIIQLENSITQIEEKVILNLKYYKDYQEDTIIKLLTKHLPRYNTAFLIIIASEIEVALQSIAFEAKLSNRGLPLSPTKLIEVLVEAGAIHLDTTEAFSRFWQIRSQIVYSIGLQLDEARLLAMIEIGVRILKLLRVSYYEAQSKVAHK